MTFFEWDNKYAIHIQEIDRDHQKLLELVNHLYASVFECEDMEAERALTGKTLMELVSYSQYHFLAEEKLMKQYDYPGYEEHKREHVYFINKVNSLLAEHRAGEMALSFPTFVFLKEWLGNHILDKDKQYGRFFMDKGSI